MGRPLTPRELLKGFHARHRCHYKTQRGYQPPQFGEPKEAAVNMFADNRLRTVKEAKELSDDEYLDEPILAAEFIPYITTKLVHHHRSGKIIPPHEADRKRQYAWQWRCPECREFRTTKMTELPDIQSMDLYTQEALLQCVFVGCQYCRAYKGPLRLLFLHDTYESTHPMQNFDLDDVAFAYKLQVENSWHVQSYGESTGRVVRILSAYTNDSVSAEVS